jgi:hypothetical protein
MTILVSGILPDGVLRLNCPDANGSCEGLLLSEPELPKEAKRTRKAVFPERSF